MSVREERGICDVGEKKLLRVRKTTASMSGR